MAKSEDAVPQPPASRRDRSIEGRRKARRKKGARERRIVDLLNRGISTAEIAAAEGVTLRRMQILVKTILARHALRPLRTIWPSRSAA
jgi:DNA-binding CsgD family transcriptional regulator